MNASTSHVTKQFSAESVTKKRRTRDGDVFSVEPRMKKAVSARIADTEMAVAADSCSRFKRGCAPSNVISLGGDCFLTYSLFMGQTRIHIRKYVCVEEYYRPTREGVCMSPRVWISFCDRATGIAQKATTPEIIESDLMVSRQRIDGEIVFVFQRLFQRKNLSFVFLPQFVKMNQDQFTALGQQLPDITNEVKEGLIRFDLFDAIRKELCVIKQVTHEGYTRIIGHGELQNSLGMCLVNALSPKIDEFFDYSDFHNLDVSHVRHGCISGREIKYDMYFERALFNINLFEVAKDFVKNFINCDIDTSFAEFFDVVDVKDLFVCMESKYAGDKMCDFIDLMISE